MIDRVRLVLGALVVGAMLAACARGGAVVTRPETGSARPARAEAARDGSPADDPRWIYTDAFAAAALDEAPESSSDPRLAILGGARVRLAGGAVIAWAPDAVAWRGFASVPARLGGGFLMWTEQRLAYATDFLGPVTWVEGEPCPEAHDARPWLSSMIVRSEHGLFAVDVTGKAKPLAHRVGLGPGIVDGRALDASVAARIDATGRASTTTDGGRSWTDVLTARGKAVATVGLVRGGTALALRGAGRPLLVSATGVSVAASDNVDVLAPPRLTVWASFGAAIAAGASVPGARAMTGEGTGLETFSLRTGVTLSRADVPFFEGRFQRFTFLPSVEGPPRIAGVAEHGAVVLDVEDAVGRMSLEASFPIDEGAAAPAGFVAGPNGRALYIGRCGSDPPTLGDLDAPPAAPDGGAPAPTTTARDDARVCVRAAPSRWIERRLRGPDVHVIARWIPGDRGEVTALVLAPPGSAATVAPTFEGVRVVRLDPEDDALRGAQLAPVPQARADVDFWLDPESAVRGWIRLEGGARDRDAPRIAVGIRVDEAGRAVRFPLPAGVKDVVTGGPYAIARAPDDASGARWYESTDGGATWREIDAPPGGELDGTPDDEASIGCSALGCAWKGMTRVGWGGRKDMAARVVRREPKHGVTKTRAPVLVCDASVARLDRETEPYSLATELLPNHPLRETIAAAFKPSAPAERVTLMGEPEAASGMSLAAVLPRGARAPIGLVMSVANQWREMAHGTGAFPLGRFKPGSVAEVGEGLLAFLSADGATIALARRAEPVLAMRLTRPDAARDLGFTLGRRLEDGNLALIGYASGTGELFAGELDLGRAEVGVLAELGSTASLAPPSACPKATHRFVLPMTIDLEIPGQSPLVGGHGRMRALLAVRADRTHVCVDAVEGMVMASGQEPLLVRATIQERLGGGGACVVHDAERRSP